MVLICHEQVVNFARETSSHQLHLGELLGIGQIIHRNGQEHIQEGVCGRQSQGKHYYLDPGYQGLLIPSLVPPIPGMSEAQACPQCRIQFPKSVSTMK